MAIFRRGPPVTGASYAGEVGRNRDSEPIPGSMACEREVQYTQPRQTGELMTLVAAVVSDGLCF